MLAGVIPKCLQTWYMYVLHEVGVALLKLCRKLCKLCCLAFVCVCVCVSSLEKTSTTSSCVYNSGEGGVSCFYCGRKINKGIELW